MLSGTPIKIIPGLLRELVAHMDLNPAFFSATVGSAAVSNLPHPVWAHRCSPTRSPNMHTVSLVALKSHGSMAFCKARHLLGTAGLHRAPPPAGATCPSPCPSGTVFKWGLGGWWIINTDQVVMAGHTVVLAQEVEKARGPRRTVPLSPPRSGPAPPWGPAEVTMAR